MPLKAWRTTSPPAEAEKLANMESELTTASFATTPVSSATLACHDPKPSGLNMGAIAEPIAPSMLREGSDIKLRRKSKLCMNHRTTLMANIMVPAFSRKCSTRSQTWVNTLRALGMRYGGSSITNGASCLFEAALRKIRPESMPSITPRTYRLSITRPRCSLKNAPAISPYTGSFAEQLMNGSSNIVMRRSRSLSIVRAPIAAGTVQPKPISSGMKLFPLSPKRRIGLSIINAMRLM